MKQLEKLPDLYKKFTKSVNISNVYLIFVEQNQSTL